MATARAKDLAAVKETGLAWEREQGLAKDVDLVKDSERLKETGSVMGWGKESGKGRDLVPDTRFDRQPWGRAKHSLRYCAQRPTRLDIAALRRWCCLPIRIHLLGVDHYLRAPTIPDRRLVRYRRR